MLIRNLRLIRVHNNGAQLHSQTGEGNVCKVLLSAHRGLAYGAQFTSDRSQCLKQLTKGMVCTRLQHFVSRETLHAGYSTYKEEITCIAMKRSWP